MPFHPEDLVEEIATKRQGKIQGVGGTVGQEYSSFTVFFLDGKDPLIKHFKAEQFDQLRLVKCPHENAGEPGFYPATSIMD